MQLFHFSEDKDIHVFEPRPVAIAAPRAPGMDWLNGPLVWAIDAWHQPMYLFPRDCPRVLVWPTGETTADDRQAHWPTSGCCMLAYIEEGWVERLSQTVLYRYTLPGDGFESLNDAGMWVSHRAATPSEVTTIGDLPAALAQAEVELRIVPNLAPLKALRLTTLHVSALRLRNSR